MRVSINGGTPIAEHCNSSREWGGFTTAAFWTNPCVTCHVYGIGRRRCLDGFLRGSTKLVSLLTVYIYTFVTYIMIYIYIYIHIKHKSYLIDLQAKLAIYRLVGARPCRLHFGSRRLDRPFAEFRLSKADWWIVCILYIYIPYGSKYLLRKCLGYNLL